MVNEPIIPIAVNDPAMMIGVCARGTTTVVMTFKVEAPQSFADSISASGTACTPELIIKIENGSEVQTEPMTIAVEVEVRVGKLIPMLAKKLRIKPSPP